MNPLPRLCDFFSSTSNVLGEDANAKAGTRIVQLPVEGRIIDAGGAGYNIQGKILKSTGQKIFEVGEVVPVLFKNNEPVVILGHTWRKAQFEEIPAPITGVGPLEIVVGMKITPPPVEGEPLEPDFESFVIFTQLGQFVIDPADLRSIDNQPPDDPNNLDTFNASWGENPNTILLNYRLAGVRTQAVYKINRGIDATNLPIRPDPADETQPLIKGTMPVVSGQILGTPIRETDNDISLGRFLTATENLTFTTDQAGSFQETSDPNCPGEHCVGIGARPNGSEIVVFGLNQTQETFTISRSSEMFVGGPDPDGPIGQQAYSAVRIHSFLNKSNHIIQIYSIQWRVGRMFDFDPANEVIATLFSRSTTDPIFDTISERLAIFGFSAGNLPFFSGGNGIISTPSILTTASGTIAGGHNALEDAGGYSLAGGFFEAYAQLRILPAFNWNPGGNVPQVFDMFSLNRNTNQVLGATFGDVELSYDREINISMGWAQRRNHLDSSGLPDHTDVLVLSRPAVGVRTASFFDSGQGTGVDTLDPEGPFYLVDENPEDGIVDFISPAFPLVHNIQFTGREPIDGLRLIPGLFNEELVIRDAIGIHATFQADLDPAPPAGTITKAGGVRPTDTFNITAPTEEEPQFQRLGAREFHPLVNKGAFIGVLDQRIRPSDSKRQIFRWPVTGNTVEVLAIPPGFTIPVNQIRAHDHSIFVRMGGSFIVLAGGVRTFKAGFEHPPFFEFIKPGRGTTTQASQSYTNDRNDDRKIYQVTLDPDTGEAIVTQTSAPPNTDIVDLKGFMTTNGQLSFHYAGVA